MTKDRFNSALRKYVKDQLSPTPRERELVSQLYGAVCAVLGESNCIQIGSYPRFTANTPLHDLDVLYTLGTWNGLIPNPGHALAELKRRIEKSFDNPTAFTYRVSAQTHSITITFLRGNDEVFSVDIVPAYKFNRNEFGNDMYMVPEILTRGHLRRRQFYEELTRAHRPMNWIASDPRGYIEVAKRINAKNADFRKSVKFAKAWKSACKRLDERFKLKSFHIEQVITQYFLANAGLEIFDAIFKFFYELPEVLQRACIPDRADAKVNIDEYINQLTKVEKATIIEARDFFLKQLEDFSETSSVGGLLEPGFHKRASGEEAYLFDFGIRTLTEDHPLTIRARVLPRDGGFRERILDTLGLIDVDRKIQFRVAGNPPPADLFKWKVKNDDASIQPRGEITDHSTANDPEYTKFKGNHYVECYAIRNGTCIAKARQNVKLAAC